MRKFPFRRIHVPNHNLCIRPILRDFRPSFLLIILQSFYRLGSALMELGKYERALETLRDGLNTSGAEEDKYDIFKKIMKLAFNCEGIVVILSVFYWSLQCSTDW